jgi:hypothetical protein
MSEHAHIPHPSTPTPDSPTSDSGDGKADVIATIALITLVVSTVSFWLHSFAS